MNTKRNILRQSINKIAKFKDQERILKTAREKQHIKGKKSLISLSADFSAGWKNWHDILNRSKEETDNHNSLLSRSSFGIELESKSFIDKQKLKEFITTKLALQNMLKKLL